jgi:hypothetical protein
MELLWSLWFLLSIAVTPAMIIVAAENRGIASPKGASWTTTMS